MLIFQGHFHLEDKQDLVDCLFLSGKFLTLSMSNIDFINWELQFSISIESNKIKVANC